jgi:hypothetical protein
MRDLALEHYLASFSHLASTPDWEIVKQSFLKQIIPFNNEVKLRVDLDHLRQNGSGPDSSPKRSFPSSNHTPSSS